MAGSIRARPDRGSEAWELRIFLGRDRRGAVRHKSKLFRGSRRAAEHELARLIALQDFEPENPPDDATKRWGRSTTINEAMEAWKQNGWGDLSPVTVRRYENVWRLHIERSVGKERIASLTPYDVEQYFRQLKTKGVGRETVRYVRAMLNRVCKLARKWSANELPNPIADTELPSWGIDGAPRPVRSPTARRGAALARGGTSARSAIRDMPPRHCGNRHSAW